MFIIIGGDGKEYGPVSAEQVRAWIAAGRANVDTQAKAIGSEEWRRVGDFVEFSTPGGGPPVIGADRRAGATVVSGLPDPLLAERGTRLAARAIDWAIEIAVAIPGLTLVASEIVKLGQAVLQGQRPTLDMVDVPRLVQGATVFLVASLILLAVQVWMLTTRGQSIGKRVMKLRIVRFADDSAPGIVRAWVLREIPMTVIGVMLGLVPFLGVPLRIAFHLTDWCLIFRDDRRCLHDLMADTKVIRA